MRFKTQIIRHKNVITALLKCNQLSNLNQGKPNENKYQFSN